MDDAAAHALTVLARLVQRRPAERPKLLRAVEGRLDAVLETAVAVATETGGAMGDVLAEAFSASPDLALLERARVALPLDSIALRSFAVQVHGTGRRAPPPDSDDEDGWLAHVGGLNVLSYAQRRAGLSAEAIATARDGVALARRLERDFPGRYVAAIASTLNMLAASLPPDETGAAESVGLLQEAVEIARGLAEDHPEKFEGQLADHLNDLAWSARAGGDLAVAVRAAREAVERLERRPDGDGQTALRNLASAHYTLGSMLCDTGAYGEALPAAEAAVRLRQEAARSRPDAELVDLVDSRILHAEALLGCGRDAEAIEVAQRIQEELRWLVDRLSDPLPGDVAATIVQASRLMQHLAGDG